VLVHAGAAGCGDGGGDLSAFCATARRFAADNPAAAFARIDPADPGSAAGPLRDAGERLSAWAAEAPAAVDEDVEVLADAATTLAAAFEAPGEVDRAAVQDEVAGVDEASRAVLSFTRERCEVDLDPGPVPAG
jgi:hypothetical protein